jgi:AraC-like DNA-binding protein
MSHVRQEEPAVRGYAVTHPAGLIRPPHDPAWDSLNYATRGVMTVRTTTGSWVLPPHRAVWVPAELRPELQLSGRTSLHILYASQQLHLLPPVCRVVDVTPLARELVLHAVRTAPLWLDEPVHRRLLGVLADQLVLLPEAGLQLPLPSDPRALDAARRMELDPADDAPVAELARRVATSKRSLERLFMAETGMSVARWRRRARMLEALRMLAAGATASTVATRVGYATPSAFGVAFRAELGSTPAQWAGRADNARPGG